MNIGWSKLYSYLTRKPGKYSAVGIEYNQNGLHLCALRKHDQGHIWSLSETFPLSDWREKLAEFVSEHEMANSHTVISFATKKYHLVQADRPQVPDEELAQALQWSVKDLIVTQEEVVTDYFELPAQTTGANKVNVVALPKDDLFAVCEGVLKANLFIRTVTVEELCNCDLIDDSNDAVLAVIQDPAAEVCLNIIKNRNLYFSRRIRGYENLSTFTEAELQMGVIDNLSVELQRSMDFFEGQLRQAPVKKIIMQLDNDNLAAIVKMVGEAMLVTTEMLNPGIVCEEGIEFKPDDLCALGAAMSLVRAEEAKTPAEPESEDAA
ncbi:MAG: MSHA biogenesis protein MshI [Aestuariibacter sp.]